jgi:hypothetical protein
MATGDVGGVERDMSRCEGYTARAEAQGDLGVKDGVPAATNVASPKVFLRRSRAPLRRAKARL